MDYEMDKILEISLAKIDRNKTSRKQTATSNTLRRNLLVSSVLKAIKTDTIPSNEILMDYRETKLIDMDLEEAEFEITRRESLHSKSYSKMNCPANKVHEWKPRASDECSDFEIRDNFDTEMVENNESDCSTKTFDIENHVENIRPCVDDVEHDDRSQTINNKPDLRKSLSFKRPRDSDFDMSHMPRPNKICRAFTKDDSSCEFDTQAITCLETMFKDSFTDLVDQSNYDRPMNMLSFPLVSVMAC